MLRDIKLALIGAGQMGGALLSGLIESGKLAPGDIVVSEPRAERSNELKRDFGVNIARDNRAAVAESSVILLAVKPQQIDAILAEIEESLDDKKILVSIAAGIDTDYIYKKTKKKNPVLRVMPNSPALIGKGMAVVSPGRYASKASEKIVQELFSCVGEVVVLDEKYQNQSTAINGSGPAYLYLFVESLIDAAVKVGLPRDVAAKLVIETVVGAALMLKETGKHPALLRDMVTSPGGTTMAALKAFEEGGLRGAVFNAVEEAVKRADELGGKN